MSTLLHNLSGTSRPGVLRRTAGCEVAPAPALGPRTVILHADDLGLLYAFNEGIRRAHLDGHLTSTSLRANGQAYDHAIRDVLPDCPRLGVGIHLCLNEGPSVAPPDDVPLLLGPDRSFRTGYRWLMKLARSQAGRGQIEREFRAQIERVLADGVRLDHFDSHQHVHMIPDVFWITCRLARDYDVACLRLVREPAYAVGPLARKLEPLVNTNRVKHLLLNRFARLNAPVAREFGLVTPDYFVGVNYAGRMDVNTVVAGLTAARYGTVEVLLHPTVGPDPRDTDYPAGYLRGYVASPHRARELQALRSTELAEFLANQRWGTATFADSANAWHRRRPEQTTIHIDERVRRLSKTLPLSNPPWVSAAEADARAFAQLVLSQVQPGQRVLDLGTGTGLLAVCLAKLGHHVVATDLSAAAVRTALANAARNGVSFECYRSDLLNSAKGRFDVIAFNPPYNFRPDTFAVNVAKNLLRRVPRVRRTIGEAIPPPVLRFHQQLLKQLLDQAPDHLNPGGAVLLHVFECEVDALINVLPADADFKLLRHPDLAAHGTAALCVRPRGKG